MPSNRPARRRLHKSCSTSVDLFLRLFARCVNPFAIGVVIHPLPSLSLKGEGPIPTQFEKEPIPLSRCLSERSAALGAHPPSREFVEASGCQLRRPPESHAGMNRGMDSRGYREGWPSAISFGRFGVTISTGRSLYNHCPSWPRGS